MNISGKLDRYLARSFLAPFLLATAAIVGLYLVADIFGSLSDFLQQADSLVEAASRIAQVYVLRIPTFIAPVLPIAMLIGASYGMSQLTANNEVTAMKASGLSFWRILTPVYALGVAVALLGFANRELLVPPVERVVAPRIQEWTGHDKPDEVMIWWEPDDTFFRMKYNALKRTGTGFLAVKDRSDGTSDRATAMEVEPVRGGLTLRTASLNGQPVVAETVWPTTLRARDLEMQLLPTDVRPIKDLLRAMRGIDKNPDPDLTPAKKAAAKRPLLLEYYQRIAYPLSGIVLMALGIPFVVGHERIQRSRVLGIGVCVIISMVFYAVQFLCLKLGQDSLLPPAAAAFLPAIIFGGLGVYMLDAIHS